MSEADVRPPRQVNCPGCTRPTEFSPANPYRPFCSARCKAGDFGAWASERYRVEAPALPHDDPPAGTH